MIIGIDAHNLELGRGGAAHRYLFNLLKIWNESDENTDLRFILYFKDKIPEELNILRAKKFEKKILNAPFGIKSNALFVHYSLAKKAKKDKADILWSPYYILPIFYNGKTAVTLHDIFYEADPKAFSWPSVADKILLKWISKYSSKKADVIFTPSLFSKNEVIKYYKVNPEKIFVTHLGVEEKFSSANRFTFNKMELKNKYGIQNKYVFYIASIFNRRHLIEVISAFAAIADKISNYQLLIIGKNQTNPFINIKKIIEDANNKTRKNLVIYKETAVEDDLVSLYTAADLFIWLSDYEGFGLPVLEAQTAGIPVITSSSGSLSEVAGSGAIFVKNSSNIAEISAAIEKGLTDETLRNKVINLAKKNSERFSWKKCAKETLKQLLEAI